LSRRLPVVSLLCVGALSAMGSAAQAAVPVDQKHATVDLTACGADGAASGDFLKTKAKMLSLRTGNRLKLRFELFKRGANDATYSRFDDPVLVPQWGLNVWHTAKRGSSTFTMTRFLNDLPEATTYQVVAKFRWVDAKGRVFAQAKRYASSCYIRPEQSGGPGGGDGPGGI
jgi:hypothetical protein